MAQRVAAMWRGHLLHKSSLAPSLLNLAEGLEDSWHEASSPRLESDAFLQLESAAAAPPRQKAMRCVKSLLPPQYSGALVLH